MVYKKGLIHIILILLLCLVTGIKTNIIAQENENDVSIDSLDIEAFEIEEALDIDLYDKDTSEIEPIQFDDLSEKYIDDEFIYERTIDKSGWWYQFKEWLNSIFRTKNSAQSSNTVDVILKVFYVAIFILVVFFIAKAIINKEGRWVFGKSSAKNIIPVTDLEDNIHATDFETLVQECEKNNNYRLAIRYYYLWLIKALTSAEIIEFDVEKTNSDYQDEIESKELKEEFAYTSYLYNYIWYGEFNINQEQFEKARVAFRNFLKLIEK